MNEQRRIESHWCGRMWWVRIKEAASATFKLKAAALVFIRPTKWTATTWLERQRWYSPILFRMSHFPALHTWLYASTQTGRFLAQRKWKKKNGFHFKHKRAYCATPKHLPDPDSENESIRARGAFISVKSISTSSGLHEKSFKREQWTAEAWAGCRGMGRVQIKTN